MTALKAHEVSRYLDRPDLKSGVFLVYGGDSGLVRETARRLLDHFAGPSPDPMALVSLDGSEVDADPSRLATEARTPPMFGGARIIRIRNAPKSLADSIDELLADPFEAVVVLEAGNLAPRDRLRAVVEKHSAARALPCYADSGESLNTLIRKTFSEAGITPDADVIPALADILGNDREITRSELEKLVLFAADTGTLSRDDVLVLCGDNAGLAMDQVADAVGAGHTERLDQALVRAAAAGVDAQRLLSAALQHFSALRRWRGEVDSGRPPRAVLDGLRPKPHFSRLPALEQQLRLWSDETLGNACVRLHDAVSESRRHAAIAPSIAHRALLAVCLAAARH